MLFQVTLRKEGRLKLEDGEIMDAAFVRKLPVPAHAFGPLFLAAPLSGVKSVAAPILAGCGRRPRAA